MPDGEERVQSMLKATIETNLARERAFVDAGDLAGVAFHSNGIIFSRSGNGTPFSNGIIFSRTGSHHTLPALDPEHQVHLVQQLAGLDEVAFTAFTERLVRLRETKSRAAGSESS
jgi:hypothetical protein